MNRRDFLRTAGGTAGGTTALAASGSASATEDGGGGGGGGSAFPDWGGYLSSANNYGGTGSVADMRGESEVTISVGAGENGLAFDPAAVWIDAGTTVTWEWTGNGGNHNVVSDESDIDSGAAVGEEGATYEQTFEESAIHKYYCSPHQTSGMLGALAVGEDIPTVQPQQGGGEVSLHEMGVPIQAHWVGIATILAIGISFVFTFFMLKYGESAHTKGGNN